MKPRKFQRKLFLNKKTIADLNNGELRHVKGGGPNVTVGYTCLRDSCPSDCPCPTEISCPDTPNPCTIT